ncbi:probable leucine-rich repeat receptor-like protein kinase At1g35710 [Camellia sinensis]|uniref:probable leucine-rich repeat receptor-like protein kinase At1g35710 n=1 Tax=Camellia sinensis TaxID=4442 RepID=UPI00103563D8|nr:probable leucine-rich repeat receptor-like protein kinase At1g35710 [Camellia sinensis]
MSLGKLVQIAYLDISGQFPCWVANLTQLVCLNIGLNELTGPIAANLRGFSNLRYLCSAYNSNTGTLPIWLYNLPSLKYLSLASNEFTGQIYEFQSKSLNHINWRRNKLQGPIPPFSTIINLFLSINTFTGEIPSTICNVSFLEILDFSHNSLSGVIPQCLANFSNVLSVLDLRMNNFHRNIPSTFTEGKKLRNIDLNDNQLEGRVPRSLATCRHLEVLDIGNNKINDTFPYWLEFLPELQVPVFKSNKFHGPVDSSVDSSPHGIVGGVKPEEVKDEYWIKMNRKISKTARNRALVMRRLVNLKLRNGVSIAKHTSEFKNLVNQLATVKMPLDDEMQAVLLLSSLPDNWETLVFSLNNTAPEGKLTMSMLTDAMYNEETRRKDEGHIKRNYPSRKDKGQSNKSKGDENTTATTTDKILLAVGEKEDCLHIANHSCIEWVIDTATSYHVTSHRDLFSSYNAGDFGNVRMRNSSYSKIVSIGDISIQTNAEHKLVLKDVRHVPDLHLNLSPEAPWTDMAMQVHSEMAVGS